ncbi:heparinase [Rhodocytophaga rosea]|uniref:Heparinase n=1 Tax=Rhodocytophaga rosea TaxID=2704465 RepID=A0A6C0GK99_9BACT|nr:alginate lyase family protein [Rhodocytophaga rosea]QHT68082.1 heparinase [Rhodocytophaga rosea]
MGWKGFLFRATYEFRRKSGLLKSGYPTKVKEEKFSDLAGWKNKNGKFFFSSKEDIKKFDVLSEVGKEQLKQEFNQFQQGKLKFFNGFYLTVGTEYDWVTNPETGYKFDITKHWTKIKDLDPAQGDIKYVWEKSRFSYLYTIIRYDFHFQSDQSELVFKEILDWIKKNPLNYGPNYISSQEIALRLLNWTFALYYYKNSPHLTEEVFQKIIHSIYWQAKHVEKNIDFSRIAVRNNHAITECAGLYLIGWMFPFLPESQQWQEEGKEWLEEEGLYQIYPDGSFLQFSMNYHRIVIQLFTWIFYLGKKNGDIFSIELNKRLKTSVEFLYQHQDLETGHMPNYGANDGSLFFPLNACSYRDFRPQLNALYHYFYQKPLYGPGEWNEDLHWYGYAPIFTNYVPEEQKSKAYKTGGFFVLRDAHKFAFIRCGSHKDRPSQADNLHVDLWLNGKNIIRDGGSFKYNASPEDLKFFMGTASHNTIQLDDHDQMLRGGRFIWYYWSQALEVDIFEQADAVSFQGKAQVFQQVNPDILHLRKVKQYKNSLKWKIEDIIQIPANVPGLDKLLKKQIWNISPEFLELGFTISTIDQFGKKIEPITRDVFFSNTYGMKESSKQIVFESTSNFLQTIIELPQKV